MNRQCMDYDSMGNHGRFPKSKDRDMRTFKSGIQKIMMWFSFKFPKKRKKDIWKL